MKDFVYKFILLLFRTILPISKRKILFLSYYGEQYGCNPKYLSEYLLQNNGFGWKIIWTLNENRHIDNVTFVRYLSMRFLYHLSTAKVIVTNYRMTDMFTKRHGQVYVQTWHSSLRLKMIEKDTEATLPSHYVEMAKRDSRQIDVLLSGCGASSDIFRRCFWYDGFILESGTPRCDALVNNDYSRLSQLKRALGIDDKSFILLYAPTFRKNNSLSCYDVDFNKVANALQSRFSKSVQILLRLHPHLKEYSKSIIINNPNLIDVTRYDDIQELLMISDCLITDYSGLMFDFMLTKRPAFLYVPDLENYLKNDRKLYFDIKSLPFPICRNNDSLEKAITNCDLEQFKLRVEYFNRMVESFEDGHASERVIKYLENLISDGR